MIDRHKRPPEERWQWDIVTWCLLGLVAAFALLGVIMRTSHSGDRQLEDHLKDHSRAQTHVR